MYVLVQILKYESYLEEVNNEVEVAMMCMRRERKIVVAVNLGKPCEIDGRFRPAC